VLNKFWAFVIQCQFAFASMIKVSTLTILALASLRHRSGGGRPGTSLSSRCAQAGSASNLTDAPFPHQKLLDLNLTSSRSVVTHQSRP
jgi:hypothetical protein